MIFVPSYLDYVRLRSFLRTEEMEFEGLSEYADGGEVARGRSRFAKGETRLAVYTERAHFYHRRFTRGVMVGHPWDLLLFV
jgi:U3 small nucleolar RNA-associated protein 25